MNLRPLDPQSSAIPNFATPGYLNLSAQLNLEYTNTLSRIMQEENSKKINFFDNEDRRLLLETGGGLSDQSDEIAAGVALGAIERNQIPVLILVQDGEPCAVIGSGNDRG